MKEIRNNKITSLIVHLAAQFVIRHSGTKSMITITTADISSDMKNSKIYFTVIPTEYEEEALSFLKRQRSEFRDFVKKDWTMRVIPFFDFEIDAGERNRQKIDELLNKDNK